MSKEKSEALVARELILALRQCPECVQKDVLNRVSDHLESGGSFDDDDYVAINQLRYAQRMRNYQTRDVDKPV